jgi:hypothetical protein
VARLRDGVRQETEAKSPPISRDSLVCGGMPKVRRGPPGQHCRQGDG